MNRASIILLCISIAFLGVAIGQEVNCEDLVDITKINEGYNYVEGDIIIPLENTDAYVMSTDPSAPQNAVATDPENLWDGAVLPYELSPNLNQRALNAITNAMNFYTSNTCVTFVQRTTQANWVYFFPGGGCYSYIGNIGIGRQELSIGRGCEFDGIVEHEIFHALGRWHEQSRADRNSYIRINEQNVIQAQLNNFERVSENIASTQNLPYDFRSIMHYGRRAFSSNGQDTITTLDSNNQGLIGQRERLSDIDIEHVLSLYCNDTTQWGSWGQWSSCPEACNDYSRVRTRSCVGNGCPGASTERESCGSSDCTSQASWGEWGTWTQCSVSCGGSGYRYRLRTCQGGNNCPGLYYEIDYTCNSQTCVMAEWSEWSEFSACSQSCGGGTRTRTRTCSLQNQCVGPDSQALECNLNACPDDEQIIANSLRHLGCFEYQTGSNLFYYSNGSTFTLDIQVEAARQNAIVKCSQSTLSRGRLFFSMIDGYCIQEGSDANTGILEFIEETSTNCINQIGSYQNSLAMSLWYIYDPSGITSRQRRQLGDLSNNNETDTSEMDRQALECGINVVDTGNGVGNLTPTLFSIVMMFAILLLFLH